VGVEFFYGLLQIPRQVSDHFSASYLGLYFIACLHNHYLLNIPPIIAISTTLITKNYINHLLSNH